MSFFRIFSPRRLPLVTLCCSALAAVLNLLLRLTGFDDKGLLISGHWAGVMLCVLAALFFAALFLCVRTLDNLRYKKMFPASPISAAGCWVAGAGILYAAVTTILQQRSFVSILYCVLALAAAVSLVFMGLCRRKGSRPNFVLPLLVTLFFMPHLLLRYQEWSAEPQVMLYLFPLLSCVLTMLTAYQATCLAVKKGSRRWYAFVNQAAVFCCCASIVGDNWLFYLTMAVWNAGSLCSLQTKEA